jgi:DNA-binding MarR family transcriptional regulator
MFVTNHNGDTPASAPGNPASDALQIATLYGAMWRRFQSPRRRITGSDVTPRMLAVLRHLASAGPLTVGEQALHLGISRATATELVDRLQTKGLIERLRDDRDQRRVFIWLTDSGRAQVTELAGNRFDDPFLAAVATLPVATRRQLIDGLSALLVAADVTTPQENVS